MAAALHVVVGSGLKAGIFDLGGVVIDWNPRHLYRKLFPGDPEGMERFLAEVCTPAWNSALDGGRSFHEAVRELQEAHPAQTALIAAYWDRWPEMIGGVNEATVVVLRDLRDRGLRLYALSDWSAETFPLTRHLVPALDLFDDILISGEAQMTKPDPRLFAMACARFGIIPSETFFVDDIPRNVTVARKIGLTAIQFTGAEALRGTLVQLGWL
jgi:2-haloacid dehalogenase